MPNAARIFTHLISTSQAQAHLKDPLFVFIDVRYDLMNLAWGEEDYRRDHIPGAVFADLERDLSVPGVGRHVLPPVERMAEVFSNLGVDSHRQVVAYDTSSGAFAARLWWMLRFLGHQAVAILDGGYLKWSREERPAVSGTQNSVRRSFVPNPQTQMLLRIDEVEQIRRDPSWKLVDARSAVRFRGEQEPIDPVAGRIPGALNAFHGDNLDPDGVMLSKRVLRHRYQTLIGDTPAERVVLYCGSGVTSCHDVIAMEYAGLGLPRLYAGSFSEWCRTPGKEIATG